MAQIAGVEPDTAVAVTAEGLGSFTGVVHVTQHHRGAGNTDLTLGVGRLFLHRAGFDDLIIGIGEGNADGTGPGVILGGQAGSGDTFRGAVALPDLLGASVEFQESVHFLLQFRGQGITAAENALQEAEVGLFQLVRPEQGFKQGGHAGDQLGLVLQQGVGVNADGELGHQNTGRAADEGGVDADAQTKTVEHGHDGQHLHTGHTAETGSGNGLQAQGVEIQGGQHDALGGAGGTAGVEDGGAVVGAGIMGRQLGLAAIGEHVGPEGIAGLGELLHRPGILGEGIGCV